MSMVEQEMPPAVVLGDVINLEAFSEMLDVELTDCDVTPEELDADPALDEVTPGFAVRLHRTGFWALCINGEFYRFFRDFEDAKAACAEAEADWARHVAPPDEPRPSAFEGHPAWEGGE